MERQTHLYLAILKEQKHSHPSLGPYRVFHSLETAASSSSRCTCKSTETGIVFHMLVSFSMVCQSLSEISLNIFHVIIHIYIILLRRTLSKVAHIRLRQRCPLSKTMSSTSPHPLSAGTERIGCRPSFRIHGLVLKLGSEVHVARKAGDVRMRMIPVFKQGKAGGNKAKEIAILKICRWFCSIWIMPGVISKVQKNNGT